MEDIVADSRFEQTDGLEITDVPDGRVVYQASAGKVHYLNPTAVIVLELCSSGQSPAEVVAFLQDAFSLAAPPTDEVNACLRSLVDEDLLRRSIR